MFEYQIIKNYNLLRIYNDYTNLKPTQWKFFIIIYSQQPQRNKWQVPCKYDNYILY